MKAIVLMSAAASLLLSGNVAALQDSNNTESALAERLLRCQAVESSLERLDCYDRIARGLAAEGGSSSRGQERAAQARAQADAAREAAAERRQRLQDEAREQRDNFGKEHRADYGDDDQRRYVTIEESWQNARGLWRFRTEDGSEWHQVESGRYFALDADARYYIERGAMNSFRLSHDDTNRSITVRRVD